MALSISNDSLKFSLYAINILLQSINELPVNSDVEVADLLEAQIAESVLEETKKEVLAMGWDTNSDKDWTFMPDTAGHIALGSNILNISDSLGQYFMRDWLLYDKKNQTFKFEEAVKCDVTWDIDFNSLPHAIRYYITMKASRTFQYRQVGDTAQFQFSSEDISDAYISARHSESFTGKYSLKGGEFGLNFGRTN